MPRYSKKILAALGQLHSEPFTPVDEPEPLLPSNDMNVVACGRFKEIIDTIFTRDDGSLPNALSVVLTDNTPDSVKQFVRNVLSSDMVAMKPAADDDVAFATLLPRSMQCGSGLDEYRSMLTSAIRRYSSEYKSKNPPKSN